MFYPWSVVAVILCVLLTFSEAEVHSCYNVQQAYVHGNLGASNLIPDTPISGNSLKVCTNSQTCCTKRVEEKFLQQAKLDFQNAVQESSAYTKFFISTNAVKYQGSRTAWIGLSVD
ncbi:glypican-5-like [Saccoglossus kowalevskii]